MRERARASVCVRASVCACTRACARAYMYLSLCQSVLKGIRWGVGRRKGGQWEKGGWERRAWRGHLGWTTRCDLLTVS